ncbi:MAG: DUF4328 domain-containing protein [Myxococcota bacterium]
MSTALESGLDYIPAAGRAKLAILGLTLCGVLSFLSFVSNAWFVALLPQFDSPAALVDASLMGHVDYLNELDESLLWAWVVVFWVTVVFYCRWLHRAYGNVVVLASRGRLGARLRYRPSQAVWSFFIPFINLVRPYRVVAELWRCSGPTFEGPVFSCLVGAWWAMWLGGTMLARHTRQMVAGAGEDTERLMSAWSVAAIGQLLMVGAAVLAIMVIREVGQRQAARADWLAALVPGRLDPVKG